MRAAEKKFKKNQEKKKIRKKKKIRNLLFQFKKIWKLFVWEKSTKGKSAVSIFLCLFIPRDFSYYFSFFFNTPHQLLHNFSFSFIFCGLFTTHLFFFLAFLVGDSLFISVVKLLSIEDFGLIVVCWWKINLFMQDLFRKLFWSFFLELF